MSEAQRLKHVFTIDIEICRECGGAVKVIAYIEGPVMIRKIRNHLKENGGLYFLHWNISVQLQDGGLLFYGLGVSLH